MSKIVHYKKLFLLLFLFNACNQETFYEEESGLSTIDKKISNSEANLQSNSPCNYKLSELETNESIAIDCIIDLNGQTVILPENVKIDFNGGKIENGKLVFQNGEIAGELLNSKLEIEGNAQLINNVFTFNKNHWEIIEGKVSKREAIANKINFEKLIRTVKSMSGEKMIINDLDAYFDITYIDDPYRTNFEPSLEAINIPSDFTFQMSDATHLRVFPNDFKKTSLLAVRDADNVQIIGGNLHGDRDEHDYSDGGSHEWGHLLDLHAATNTTVSRLTAKNATGDGIDIHSLGFTFQNNYRPSHNIIIKSCTIDASRRNNISITDGYDILVENNKLYRAGINTNKSNGTNPRYAIDVEAYHQEKNGKIVYYEHVENVIIRNNIEEDGGRGGFIIAVGDDIIIENNYVEDGIAFKHTANSIIRNNTIKSSGNYQGAGISAGVNRTLIMKNNEVYGNKIEGFTAGISIFGDGHLIRDNEIKNCYAGINGKDFSNTKVLRNSITSENSRDRGIFVHYTSMNRVLFKDNIIDVPNNPFKFDLINLDEGEEEYCAHVVNNTFKGQREGLFLNSNGVSLMDNKIDSNVEIRDSRNFSIENNIITTKYSDGIYLRKKNKSIAIEKNSIQTPSNKLCIRIENTNYSSDIREFNNKCL